MMRNRNVRLLGGLSEKANDQASTDPSPSGVYVRWFFEVAAGRGCFTCTK